MSDDRVTIHDPVQPVRKRRFRRMTRERRQVLAYRKLLTEAIEAGAPLRMDAMGVTGRGETFGIVGLDHLPRRAWAQHTLAGVIQRALIARGFDVIVQHRAGNVLAEARRADVSGSEFGHDELTAFLRLWIALKGHE